MFIGHEPQKGAIFLVYSPPQAMQIHIAPPYRVCSRPQFLTLPLSLPLRALAFLDFECVSPPPRRGWITDICLLDLLWLYDDHPKVLPGNWVM